MTMPRIRAQLADFVVEEVPLYALAGAGAHTYLWIEKRGQTTDALLRELAQVVGLPSRELGVAGRKDKLAITRQWVSVPELAPERALDLTLRSATVLAAVRHPHKLRTGHLRGNRFALRVCDVCPADVSRVESTLTVLSARGLTNRFGEQRFGREQNNAELGAQILRRKALTGDRRQAVLLVSALQSAVFNQVLARRPFGLDEVVAGDLAVVHATGGLFVVEDPAAEAPRVASFAISPTGPIFGTKMKWPAGEVRALEEQVLSEFGLGDLRALRLPRGLRLLGTRRPLRVPPENLRWSWSPGSDASTSDTTMGTLTLDLMFELPAGSYATVLIAELFPQGYDEGPRA